MNDILRTKLPDAKVKKYEPRTDPTNPFEGNFLVNPFDAAWGSSCGWIMAQMPSKIQVKTKNKIIRFALSKFPDHETYIRILNLVMIEKKEVTVNCSIDSADDLVRLVLILGTLRLYNAKKISVILENTQAITNGLDELLQYHCDEIKYSEEDSKPAKIMKIKPFKKKISSVDTFLYHRERLKKDAEEAATSIDVPCHRIPIVKNGDNPLQWKVSLPDGLKDKNVFLLHSSETNTDVVEQWLLLIALRRAGAGSKHLFNTYEGYSRQDNIFKLGEGLSALTMVEITDILTDTHFSTNVHYGGKSGWITMATKKLHQSLKRYIPHPHRIWRKITKYKIYNLNAFVQLAEDLFNVVAKQIDPEQKDNAKLENEFTAHPLLLLAPDDGAFPYIEEAAEVLERYIKNKHNIDVKVQCGYFNKVRDSSTEVSILGQVQILDKNGESLGNVSDCWIFVIDDETSSGATLKTTNYELVRKLSVSWQRIFNAVVHGKFPKGLEIFKTGLDAQEIKTAMEPKSKYIHEATDNISGTMPPRHVVFATQSVKLPDDYPAENKVSISHLIEHALKHIISNNKLKLIHKKLLREQITGL